MIITLTDARGAVIERFEDVSFVMWEEPHLTVIDANFKRKVKVPADGAFSFARWITEVGGGSPATFGSSIGGGSTLTSYAAVGGGNE